VIAEHQRGKQSRSNQHKHYGNRSPPGASSGNDRAGGERGVSSSTGSGWAIPCKYVRAIITSIARNSPLARSLE
jgi:hypothetical protein